MAVGSKMHEWATGPSGVESMKIGDPSEFITTAGKGLKNLSDQFKSISDKATKDKTKYEAGEAKKQKAADKEAAKVKAKRSASAAKAAATRKAKAAPRPGRSAGAIAASNYKPSASTSTNRKQSFSSAVEGGSMGASAKVDTAAASAYND